MKAKGAHSNLFEEFIVKSWWTILFFLICYFAYDQAMKDRKMEETQLRKKLHLLSEETQTALKTQEDFRMQLKSQGDSRWIELTLMKGLGLVPEGEKKVHFLRKGS